MRRRIQRYVARFRPPAASLDQLAGAIHTLLQASSSGDPFFLARGLELLTGRLGASLATLVMVAGGSAEIRWWHPEIEGEAPPTPVLPLCEWLLQHPERTLVIQDMDRGPHLQGHPELRNLPFRAVLGCALRHGEGVKGLLFAHFAAPRAFHRGEFALIEAVAGFIARVLEVEDLKQSLGRLENALAITQAVMEDSSIRDGETDLPNLRYLEVWEKAMLGSEHRPPTLVVAECRFRVRGRKDVAKVRKAAEGIRAGDLVARIAPERFQVIFQHTPRSVAHIQLLRLKAQLDGAPMGATLWVPGAEGLGLETCHTRLQAALEESSQMGQPALVWHLPDGHTEGPPIPVRARPAPSAPQTWQPPMLRKPGSR